MEPRLESVQPVLMSRDVVRSIRFYESLGFTLAGQDAPHEPKYARIQQDGIELHLQWHDAKEWDYPLQEIPRECRGVGRYDRG